VDLRLTVDLPRDLDRMGTLRHVLDGALAGLGVADQPRADIGLIVSETWTNVIAHVRVGAAFQVRATVTEKQCVIEVTHPGGRDTDTDTLNAMTAPEHSPAHSPAHFPAHSLRVVSALADEVDVDSDGLLVRVTKKL
jgi:anti-sigma regulatory factor (Ser/Thr protein kinase)